MSERAKYSREARKAWDVRGYLQAKAKALPTQDTAAAIELRGPCPACAHDSRFLYPIAAVLAATVEAVAGATAATVQRPTGVAQWAGDVRLHCLCGQTHEGQPTDEPGCGARWGVHVSWHDAQNPPTVAPPRTPTTVAGEQAEADVAAAVGDQLAGARKAAAAWQAGLAGVLTLLTSILFLKGKESIGELDRNWQWAAAGLLLAAALTAVKATWDLLAAASGTPTETMLDEVRDRGLFVWRYQQARAVAGRLRSGQLWLLGTLALVALTVGITWFGSSPPSPLPVITDANVCGQLGTADNGQYKITSDANVVTIVRREDLAKVRVVERCP